MPPKKSKIKTKSKRYSCDLCMEIDNKLMIQCEDCEVKYHLKCLNIESIEENDGWICPECSKAKSSRPTPPNNHMNSNQADASKTQTNTSKPKGSQIEDTLQTKSQENVPKSKSSQIETELQTTGHDSHKSVANDARTQNQDRTSQHTGRRSQNTRSSIGRRAQIELDRIEEEKRLGEKRDKEYLDNKYKILLEDCSNKSERSASEKRSTDRSAFTKEWVKNQNQKVNAQPRNLSQIPPNVQRAYDHVKNVHQFEGRIDDVSFDNTSPPDQNLYRESIRDLDSQRSKSATEVKENSKTSERHREVLSMQPANPLNTQNAYENKRVPCPVHDAKQFMFQERESSNQPPNVGVPISNSTFAAPQASNKSGIGSQSGNRHLYTTSLNATNQRTLEWDNFYETLSAFKEYMSQPDPTQVESNTGFEKIAKSKSSFRNMEPSDHESRDPNQQEKYVDETVNISDERITSDYRSTSYQDERRVKFDESRQQNQNPTRILNITHQPSTSFGPAAHTNIVGPTEIQSKGTGYDKPNSRKDNYEDRNYNDDFEKVRVNNRSTFDCRPMSNQHNQVINNEESWRAQDQFRPNSSTNCPRGNLTAEQIAARHVVDRKLPIFTGDPMDWPIWYNEYQNSTELCGLSNGENLGRLAKCLRDRAKDTVKSRLFHPESVPWIIETLKMLFGRPEVIIKAIITKIREHPPVKADRLDSLMDFAFEVQTICTTIESLERKEHLTDPMLIEDLVDKLPTQEKKDWAKYKAGKAHVTIKTLSIWLYDLAKVLSTVATPRPIKQNDRKPAKEKFERNEKAIGLEHVNVHFSQTTKGVENQQRKQQKLSCLTCNKECRNVESCAKFNSYSVDERYKAAKEHNLCRKCLKRHRSPCRATTVCGHNGCEMKHHSLLHNVERHNSSSNKQSAITTTASANSHIVIEVSVMLRIVPVVLYNGNKKISTYAFLDDGTTVTMMEQWIANELCLNGTVEHLCLIWTNKVHRRERAERVALEISGQGEFSRKYGLKGVRTVKDLFLPTQSMNKNELVKTYPYLASVPIMNYQNAVPGIIIGSDMPKFGTQLQVVESPQVDEEDFNGPIASKTRLGWSVHGPRNGSTTSEHVNVHQFEICPHHNRLDNEIHQSVKEYFSIENFGVQANCKINLESKEDERALQLLEQLTKKNNKKYETGLLWKSDDIMLPDSLPMAMKRLISLEKQGPEVIKTLGAKIADYVTKGYARKLTQEDLKYEGPVWYLPPFGVVHPKKPEKLRLVFDAAAKVKKVSLNSVLLKGPDLYTSLVDILRRFRERKYTGGGDILEMYHQVAIIEKDRHFQRFLFRENSSKEPDIYQLDVMTFGANCSPSSAQFVKNKNAAEFKDSHPRAVEAIIDNHYVDDMMDCEHTENKMIKLMQDVRMIHSQAGFKIRNFISNSKEVLNALGEGESCTEKNIGPKTELEIQRVLGMWYNTKSDIFTFSLKHTLIGEEILNKTKMPTKREILRTLMSIFDPLGLLSNYLIYLKILLQEIWRSQMDWDEPISSGNLVERWKRWLEILPDVEQVRVPRLYSPKMSPDKPKSTQMHVFVDASEYAFTAVVYLRAEDENGIDCALVGSKARVAPLKYLSIPRLELQAAVLGTRLSTSIIKAQRFEIDRRIIWTDSATVLSWLNSDHRKYNQFVAHRVGEILENSDVNEWRWIPTKENVADEATKCTKTPTFNQSNRWFSGPDFLRLGEDKWPKKKQVQIDIEEEMKPHFAHSSFVIPQIIDPERFTKFKRMVRSLAYAIRFFNIFTGKAKKGEPLKQDELRRAETLIIRQAQFEGYPSEMAILERNKVLPADKHQFIGRPSPLHDGIPYLDAKGVLRMKFRTDGARELSMNTKRPIVLPKDSRITRLLLLEYHIKFYHRNHETVVNEVRQMFYIPKLRAVLRKSKKICRICKNKQAHPNPPQMADLPAARLATRFVPFSFVGIDFFGPMYVMIGRRKEKRWGVLFTCLTIRAIHIELSPGLDTNSCILCIQNFVAEYGPVVEFHSDCGTNFKGADNELTREIQRIDPDVLKTEFTTTYTNWIFNPPASPHMGGAWERMIGLVKIGIDELMPTRTPKEDMLRNLLKQIKNIINSRPLTYIPLDVEEDEALTPNHFLKLSSNGLKPPCKIELDGPYLRESWKESQRLTEIFWKRFVKEYLPTLARRTKWHKPVTPLKQGDLVLIVDENSPRNTYPKAKILRTEIGSNGQVRRAKVEIISSTKTNSKGQITKVTKNELWRPAHKLALLDVASDDGLAQPRLDRKTGGSVGATKFKPKVRAKASNANHTNATGSLYNSVTSETNCQ